MKQEIRQVRKDGMDSLKGAKGSFSEDDIKRLSKEVSCVFCYTNDYFKKSNYYLLLQMDALTEKKVDKVVKLLKDKEMEITTV